MVVARELQTSSGRMTLCVSRHGYDTNRLCIERKHVHPVMLRWRSTATPRMVILSDASAELLPINQSKPVTPRRRWGTPTDASTVTATHRRLSGHYIKYIILIYYIIYVINSRLILTVWPRNLLRIPYHVVRKSLWKHPNVNVLALCLDSVLVDRSTRL